MGGAPLSYQWSENGTDIPGATNASYTTPTVSPRANGSTLAGQGYFISAFGGNDADGFILVGARVKGDTMPRTMNISGALGQNPSTAYFTPVVFLQDDPPTGNIEAWEQ